MLYFSDLGPALRVLREKRGLKQSEVAGEAGITSPMLSAYETGKQKPSFVTLDKTLAAMSYDAVDLAQALLRIRREREAEAGEETNPGSEIEARLHKLIQERAKRPELTLEERELLHRMLPGLLALFRFMKQESLPRSFSRAARKS